MKKIAAFALFGAAFAATPAHAVDPPPPPVVFACDASLTTPDALACAGYYEGNLFNTGGGADQTQINNQIAALKTIGFEWDGNWSAVNKIEANTTPLKNGNQLDFGKMLFGITYVGAHFGNVAGAPQGGGQGNVSVFWKFDFGTTGGFVTLDNTRGWSNAVLYTGTPAVPEPATWIMMLLGFAAVGASLRSRTAVRLGTKGLAKA